MSLRARSRTALAALLLVGVGGCGSLEAPDPRPNILLIVADDLGPSDLGHQGSEIETPHLDALAASGRMLGNFRVGATCSPTRAMIMSGADHHQVGLGSMGEVVAMLTAQRVPPYGTGNPYPFGRAPAGYEGYLNDRALAMPQLLRDAGYHTYMAGKWHLATQPAAPAAAGSKAPPFTQRAASFPQAKGFERSFALIEGAAPHFAPVPGKPTVGDLGANYVENGRPVTLPADFYSTTAFTDKLIAYIDADRRAQGERKPFFAYAAYTAPHWPLQAPDSDIARYAGQYDAGYEVIRQRRITRQKALGLLPADFRPNAGLDATLGRPSWDRLTAPQKAIEARKMAVYAAMVHNLDRNIGRLIQHLKDIGAYDNTLIVFTSDNGAEGFASYFPNDPNVDNSLANIGRPRSNVAYGERWAEVSATPYRLWKGLSTEGGVVSSAIVRLPRQPAAGKPLNDLVHVTDLLPTFLEAARAADPGSVYQGKPVVPISGVSQLARLADRSGTSVRDANAVVAGEQFGSRYAIRGHWKVVSVPPPFGDNRWQLFDLRRDRSENLDLAAAQPEVLASMVAAYDAYSARVGVVFTVVPPPRAPSP